MSGQSSPTKRVFAKVRITLERETWLDVPADYTHQQCRDAIAQDIYNSGDGIYMVSVLNMSEMEALPWQS